MRIWVCLLIALTFTAGCEFNPGPSPTSTPTPLPAPSGAPTALPTTKAPTASPTALSTATLSARAQPLDTHIQLTWTAVSGAQGYNIYRDGGGTPLNTAPLSDLTYDDIGLTNGRIYRYSIVALDLNGKVLTRSFELRAAPGAP